MKINRNKKWRNIWDQKYTKYKDHDLLHVQDGFDDLSYAEWQKLTHFFLSKIAIDSADDVFEIGCGAGAFSKQIKLFKSISGVDYSADAIASIRKNIPNGKFHHSEANSLPFNDNIFDKIVCFSVFFYFCSYDYASQSLYEMLRVLRPGGSILIGEVSDINKKDIAIKLRGESQQVRKNRAIDDSDMSHLYYPTKFFEQFAIENNLSFQLIDEDIPDLDFYESASYRFSVLLKSSAVKAT